MSESLISGLYRQTINDRIQTLIERGFLERDLADRLLAGAPLLPQTNANRMIENVVGVFGLPLGIAPNFLVNNRDYIVPMVVEEPSIVAGVSGAAKVFREGGGFTVISSEPAMIGQIQFSDVSELDKFAEKIEAGKSALIKFVNDLQPNLVARGGGARDIEVFRHTFPNGESIVVLHLLVDTRDAMGANLVNTMCEALAPQVEALAGGRVGLRILSNLADKAIVTARGRVPLAALAADIHLAELIRDDIVKANQFAIADPYRAATHNKGIMNGIDALAIATGNDWRAIEAGAHAYAACGGTYKALTDWSVDDAGDLLGVLTLPLKPGIVGGSLRSNPGVELSLALCGATSSTELAELMGATGLAQNFAALKALVSDGIQAGHMALHARSVASTAGVPDKVFDQVVDGMIDSGDIKVWKANELQVEITQRAGVIADIAGNAARGEAAGKIILLGEHAVVYDRHALALPIVNAVRAAVTEQEAGMKLAIPDWGIAHEWVTGHKGLPDGAAAIVELVVKEFGVLGRGFGIEIRSRIPPGMGLGSSAAFAVAVIRAFDQLLNTGMGDIDVNQLALKCEEITHGTPSGIDNNVATFARPVLFKKGSPTNTVPVQLPEIVPLVIATSSIRASTKTMVDGVRYRYDNDKALYSRIFNNIDEISLAGANALKASDYGKLGAMMNVCHGMLNAIGVSSPELENMVSIARAAGAVGAKLTGSGGGGSIVALCPGSIAEVSRTLAAAGHQIIRLSEP